jgi:tetratricopeptide (TPR) repeat protein
MGVNGLNKNKLIKITLRQKTILVIFGLFLALAVLETALQLGGFILLSLQEHMNLISMRQKGTCRIMCFGESTTRRQYPFYLEAILNQRDTGIKFSVIDKGIGGTNTEFIVSQLEANLDKYQPDLVVTMMGINDLGLHMPYQAVFATQNTQFLKSLRTYKLTKLLWLHMITKAKEMGFYKPRENIRLSQNLKDNLQKTGLKTAYSQEGNFTQQEVNSKKAIVLNPNNDGAYAGLGMLYINQGKHLEAEEALKKAITLNPGSDLAYAVLGGLYIDQGRPVEAEAAFKKAIALNPRNDRAYLGLGLFYIDQGRPVEAEEAFKKAIALNPGSDQAYTGLGEFYIGQGKPVEAEEVLKKAIALHPLTRRASEILAVLHGSIGNYIPRKECEEGIKRRRGIFYNPITMNNYRRFKQILSRRKVKWVCVQYPMRSIEPLKKMLEVEEGICFVDNEKIFKSAVQREGYREYFIDIFAGDFGHCTKKGNMLLAENITNVILKEVLGK